MPVAKHLSHARSRSRTKRAAWIDGPSFAYLPTHHDEAPRARPQASSQQPAIAAAPIASRSILQTAARFAGAAGEFLWTIASWMVVEMLDACAAYAMAMYGIPRDEEESGGATPSAPPDPARNWPGPTLHVISVNADIGAGEVFLPADAIQPCAISKWADRSRKMPGPRSGWRTAIVAPAVRLLSKIRQGYARHRAIAELGNLDDRSLRDIGISRADIDYIARHGVRPE